MHERLAVEGGPPVRTEPMPPRRLIGEEEKAAVVRLFDEAIARGEAFGYGGPEEQAYAGEFAAFHGGGFAHPVNSGTNALYAALGGLRLEPHTEVVVPAITDPGGAMPAALLGLTPVVADCDPRSYNISAETIEAAMTERTGAVVVAHIAGEPVDMDPVVELCRARGVAVVEDCAQAHGARDKGRLVGTLGDIAAFSTMSGKHHCTGGQGGVVFTRDEDLFWQARRFADRGKPLNMDPRPEGGNAMAGLNLNLGDLPAAIGRVQLRRLPEIVRRRREVAAAVHDGLRDSRAVAPGWTPEGAEPSYWFLRLRFRVEAVSADKDCFCRAVSAEGVPCAPSYVVPVAEMTWFRERVVFGASDFPWTASDGAGGAAKEGEFPALDGARQADGDHFRIPIHENYGEREAADIVSALRKVERAFGGG